MGVSSTVLDQKLLNIFSAIYRKNNIGPRTDPCGTPHSSENGVELVPLMKVRREPDQCSAGNAVCCLEAAQQNGVVICVKHCWEVKQRESPWSNASMNVVLEHGTARLKVTKPWLLLSYRASPSWNKYQIILLGNKGIQVWITCPRWMCHQVTCISSRQMPTSALKLCVEYYEQFRQDLKMYLFARHSKR